MHVIFPPFSLSLGQLPFAFPEPIYSFHSSYVSVSKKMLHLLFSNRDLGERLRKLVAEEFPQGPISKVNEPKLTAELNSFIRLSNNVYGKKYPRIFTESTSTCLDREQLKSSTSTEFYKFLESKESQSRLKRLMKTNRSE